MLLIYHQEVARCWRNLDQFFRILYNFALMGAPERSFLMQRALLFYLIDFFLGNGSPYAQHRRWKMGDEYSEPQLTHMWSLVALLSRACRTDCTKGKPPSQLQGEMHELRDETRRLLFGMKFLLKMIGNTQNSKATIEFFSHWIWENPQLNYGFWQLYQKCVCDTNWSDIEPLYTLLDAILELKDSIQEERIALYLNARNGLMEKAYRFRNQFPLFTYGCIKKLMDIAAGPNQSASKYLRINKSSLKWVETWLPTYIEMQQGQNQEFQGEDADDRITPIEMLDLVTKWLLEDLEEEKPKIDHKTQEKKHEGDNY